MPDVEGYWCPFSQVVCAGGAVVQKEYAAHLGVKCRFWGVEYATGQGTREHLTTVKDTCLLQEALTKLVKR